VAASENDPSDAPPGAPAAEAPPDDDAPVPRIGRGRHRGKWSYYFPPQQVITLFALLIGLFAVLSLRESCSRGAGNLLQQFEYRPDGGTAPVPKP
jgi:hypothetical protein